MLKQVQYDERRERGRFKNGPTFAIGIILKT